MVLSSGEIKSFTGEPDNTDLTTDDLENRDISTDDLENRDITTEELETSLLRNKTFSKQVPAMNHRMAKFKL